MNYRIKFAPPSIKLTIILSFIAIVLTIWACKKDTIDVNSNLSNVTTTKNPKASDRTLTDPNCCEFTNLFCTSNLKPACNTVYTDNGGDDIFVLHGLVVKGTSYQLTPSFYDRYSPDFGLTTGTNTTILTDVAKDVLVENEIDANQPVEKEFAILYDIADLLQQGASIEAIQARIGNKGTIETLSNGQKQLIVNSAAFENRDVSNLSIVPSSVDCVLKKERVAQRFSDLTGIRLAICQNIIKNDPNFDCNSCNNPMRLFNHFLTMLDIKGGKNWEIVKLTDQERNAFRAGIYKAFLENGVKMSSSDASAFIASNSTMLQSLLKPTTTNTNWCVAYENGKRAVKIKVLKDKYPEFSSYADFLLTDGVNINDLEAEIKKAEEAYQQARVEIPTNVGGVAISTTRPLCGGSSFTVITDKTDPNKSTTGLQAMQIGFTQVVGGVNTNQTMTVRPMYFIITGTNVPMPQANPIGNPPNSHQALLRQAFNMAVQQFQTDINNGLAAATNPRTRNNHFERLVSRFARQVYSNFSSLWGVSFGASADGIPTAGYIPDPNNPNSVGAGMPYFASLHGTTFNPPSATTGCP